jgi:SNF2 family DNA or RNA helicase
VVAHAASDVTNIEKRGRRWCPLVPLVRMPSRRGEKETLRRGGRNKKEDATPDLFFKHSDENTCNIRLKTYETLGTCI